MKDKDIDGLLASLVELDDLRAENARLKAEVERLKEGNDCLDKMHEKEMERSAYLCEEVNRTTAWGRGLESDLSHARVEISFLKAEVERLRASSFVTAVPVEEYEKLKAEVERLKAERVHDLNQIGGLQEEVASLTESLNRHREINDELDARCNQLKAEVAELKNQPDPLTAYLYAAELGKQDKKILKAEVERLKNNCDYLDQKLDEEIDKSAMLCGQVERLRKAGDAVALDYAERIEIEAGETAKTLMKTLPVLRDWNAAKEGKPSV